MRFADPQACPDCRGAIAGQTVCPQCGLDLTSPEVRQLWQTLLQADELLVRATRSRDRGAAAPRPGGAPPTAAAPPPPPPPPPPRPLTDPPTPAAPLQAPSHATVPPVRPPGDPFTSYPRPDQPPPAQAKERPWSVGTILLVLGAFGLIVAGLIFVTRSWEDIGLAGKTLILLGVTAVMGGLGVWVTRRPLRASAEAVWTVFLALLTLDFFAARHEDLLGLRALELDWAWVVWGAIALGLSVGISVWARPLVKVDLVAPAVAGGLGITIAGVGAGAVGEDWDFAWRAIVALVVAGLLALATRPAGLRPMTITARVVFAGFFVAAYVAAFVELVDNPSLEQLVAGARGIPMLLMAIASIVVAALVTPVRIPSVALAVLAVTALVITPSSDHGGQEGSWVAIAALSAVLVVVASRGTGDWSRGLRLGAIPAVGGIVLLHIALLLDVIEAMGAVIEDPWEAGAGVRLDADIVANNEPWVAPIVLAALLVVGWFLPRWPELAKLRSHVTPVFACFAGLGVLDAVVAARLPLWLAVALLLILAVALVVVQTRAAATYVGPVALVLVAAASALAAASHEVSAVTWLLSAVVLAALARLDAPEPLPEIYAVVAVLLGLAGVAAAVELLDVDDAVTSLVVLVGALGLVAAVGTVAKDHRLRVPVEAAAGLVAVAAVLNEGSSGELAVRWTIVGVALLALCAVVTDRRWYLWPGIVSLVIAYILLIVDSGFSFVEAYTLPLGAIALAVGLYFARKRPEMSTWVLLGPGLAIALLPSVPQALVDPTDLRALLLGLGSAVVLAVGVRLGWQAPFVLGVTILTLLILFNIGPYANAAPRVALIAVLGAISMGLGITWEDRVRDGRKLVGYVRSMR
ncbi:hypothetical protein [Aeromicrobium sp.]|uniref:SCO7613 C-terminal domain-containing membrane protein n=1 Tax=Aeromicrobium sp. TaxID=1871063 RepID=UPI0030BCC19C